MLLVSCVLIAANKLEHFFGGKKLDVVFLMLTPLAMLNAESMPADDRSRKKLGGTFTRKFVLLNWSLMGMVLVFCFLCNLREDIQF